MRHSFRAEQWLPYPVDIVFDFFANPENLPRLMPSWQKARIEQATLVPAPPRPGGEPISTAKPSNASSAAGAGTRMKLSFRPFPFSPIRISWMAEISEFRWNDHFCDVQLSGPFAFWRHCHNIKSETRTDEEKLPVCGTLLIDSVEYEMHFGLAGDLAGRVFANSQLASTFAYRQRRTRELMAQLSQT